VIPALAFLLSPVFPGALAPEHAADLAKSGLSDDTIRLHAIRSVPPSMLGALLGFELPAIRSAMLIPFPDPAGGWLDHVRVKIFPTLTDREGHRVKYLQRKRSGVRLYFPLPTLGVVVRGPEPLWMCEGEKGALALAQLGLPVVAFGGIEAWHRKGSGELLADFDAISLRGRLVELTPDGDVQSNPTVARGAQRFAEALERRGARVRLVCQDSKRC
jgi:hypothetical protein